MHLIRAERHHPFNVRPLSPVVAAGAADGNGRPRHVTQPARAGERGPQE